LIFLFNDKKEILSESTKDILEMLYEHLPPSTEPQKIERDEYETVKLLVKDRLALNLLEETESALQSTRRIEQLDVLTGDFIEILFNKRITKNSVKLSYRCIYPFNSETVNQDIERDRIYRQILLNDSSEKVHTIVEFFAFAFVIVIVFYKI
jgi:hypothetical protein